MSPDALVAAAGAGLAIILAFVPKVKDWYEKRSVDEKRQLLGGAVVATALLVAKHFQSGMASVRQVELALVDLSLYRMPETDVRTPEEVLAEVRARVRVTPVYPDDRFLNGFQHIFGGGYAAGYYSYKWAEVIAADVFEAFKESGDVCSPEVGQRFLSTVLARGAARPFMESFVDFRGRTPSEDALLRLTGLLSAPEKA
jgi:oligopeptidase A